MKYDCGHPWKVHERALKRWHKWFAWRPVKVGRRDCRWLETVERKGTEEQAGYDMVWKWEYRPIGRWS
jgi:hypothetical protein